MSTTDTINIDPNANHHHDTSNPASLIYDMDALNNTSHNQTSTTTNTADTTERPTTMVNDNATNMNSAVDLDDTAQTQPIDPDATMPGGVNSMKPLIMPTLNQTNEDLTPTDNNNANNTNTIKALNELPHDANGNYSLETVSQRDKEWNAILTRLMNTKNEFKADNAVKSARIKALESTIKDLNETIDKQSEINSQHSASFAALETKYKEAQATNERLHDQISALSDESTLADKWEGMGSLASDMLRQAQNQAANIRQKAQDAAEAREAEAAKKASDIIETATNIKLESEAKARETIAKAQDDASTIVQKGTAEMQKRLDRAAMQETAMRQFIDNVIESVSDTYKRVCTLNADADNLPPTNANLDIDDDIFNQISSMPVVNAMPKTDDTDDTDDANDTVDNSVEPNEIVDEIDGVADNADDEVVNLDTDGTSNLFPVTADNTDDTDDIDDTDEIDTVSSETVETDNTTTDTADKQ